MGEPQDRTGCQDDGDNSSSRIRREEHSHDEETSHQPANPALPFPTLPGVNCGCDLKGKQDHNQTDFRVQVRHGEAANLKPDPSGQGRPG
jgi:hypothetical protein